MIHVPDPNILTLHIFEHSNTSFYNEHLGVKQFLHKIYGSILNIHSQLDTLSVHASDSFPEHLNQFSNRYWVSSLVQAPKVPLLHGS